MPPARPEQPKPLVIELTEVAHYRAELAPDQVRELFGLGGTPDDALPARLAMIAQFAPADLHVLVEHAEYKGSSSYTLEQLDGRKPGDQ